MATKLFAGCSDKRHHQNKRVSESLAMKVPDRTPEEKVPGLSRLHCNLDHLLFSSKLNDGEYMVTFESSLLQEFCFSRRLFDMQKLMMQ